jgi:hypothetical protein
MISLIEPKPGGRGSIMTGTARYGGIAGLQGIDGKNIFPILIVMMTPETITIPHDVRIMRKKNRRSGLSHEGGFAVDHYNAISMGQ